jgi:hypothetical protein
VPTRNEGYAAIAVVLIVAGLIVANHEAHKDDPPPVPAVQQPVFEPEELRYNAPVLEFLQGVIRLHGYTCEGIDSAIAQGRTTAKYRVRCGHYVYEVRDRGGRWVAEVKE